MQHKWETTETESILKYFIDEHFTNLNDSFFMRLVFIQGAREGETFSVSVYLVR